MISKNSLQLAKLAFIAATLLPGLPLRGSPATEVSDAPSAGSLIIVGGALRASNSAIYAELIAATNRSPNARIGILPAASGRPVDAANKFTDSLTQQGFDRDRIITLPLAVTDDPDTPDIDESLWLANAHSDVLADIIGGLSGIWMTGGDQSRIMQIFAHPETGAPSAVGNALLALHARGGWIGGTSAGAAVQSDVILLGGSSPAALLHGRSEEYRGMQDQEDGPLITGNGMGLFPHGIIDQHFDRKARLGRLIVALREHAPRWPHGFGIDEDTALVYDDTHQTAKVIGSGTVTWINMAAAETKAGGMDNIRVSILANGDTLHWPGPVVRIANTRKPTVDNEYHAIPNPATGSFMAPYAGRLDSALGTLLLDNSAANTLPFTIALPDGTLNSARFIQDPLSAGFWGYHDGQMESYSILNVRLQID